MAFLQSKNSSSYSIHISLKSSSIDFQIIKKNSNAKTEVLFVERNIFFIENSQDPKKYTEAYTKQLYACFEKNAPKINQIIQKNPYTITCILYTPWFTSQMDTLFFKEQITLNEDFIQEEFKKLPIQQDSQILERKIIKIQTNGYTLSHVKQIKFSNVQLDIYTSFLNKIIYSEIKNTIKRYFPDNKSISFRTNPLMMVEHVPRFIVNEDNLTFITIGSEITEVGIIQEDVLVQFSTFPVGVHDFMRVLQSNISSNEYKTLGQKEVLIKSANQQTEFDLIGQKWEQYLVQTLQCFKGHAPHKFILISHPDATGFFTELFGKILKNNAHFKDKNNRIINFDISLLKDIIEYKTPVGEDIDVILEALI